jgi:hypothetical protein
MTADQTRLVHIVDHEEQAVARLPWQWRTKTRHQALAKALGAGAQACEDALFSLVVSTPLPLATGTLLDRWGELVGEVRGGLTCTTYRQFIQARIRANRSESTMDSLIDILGIITAPSRVVSKETYPGLITAYVFRSSFMEIRHRRRVRRMMDDITPVGRYLEIIEANQGHFGFASMSTSFGFGAGTFARII